jgi:hypothetical protein
MLTLGIPEESIGLQGTPFSNAFETRFAQGGGNLNPAWSGVQNPVINVDVAALDSQFNPTSPTWATSSWKDRIDAITAHEWTEVFSPRTDTVILQGQPVLGRHIDALMNAPYTQLPITPGAKQILLEDRAYWIGGQQ